MTAERPRLTLRRRLYGQLEPSAYEGTGTPLLTHLVIWMIIASCILVILETEPVLFDTYRGTFLALELTFGTAFLIEYLARCWVSVEHPRGRAWYLTRPSSIFDLLAVISFLAPMLPVSGVLLRLLRLARILRLARLGQFSIAIRNLTSALGRRRFELLLSVGVAVVLMLLSSTLLYLVEAGHQPEAFGSIPRSLWWSVATLTTVGYGDVTPITGLGRFFAALTALSGVGIIAMPAGILASALSETIQERRRRAGDDEDLDD